MTLLAFGSSITVQEQLLGMQTHCMHCTCNKILFGTCTVILVLAVVSFWHLTGWHWLEGSLVTTVSSLLMGCQFMMLTVASRRYSARLGVVQFNLDC